MSCVALGCLYIYLCCLLDSSHQTDTNPEIDGALCYKQGAPHSGKTNEQRKRQVRFLHSHSEATQLEVAHLALKRIGLLNPAVPDAPSTFSVRVAPSDLPATTVQGTHEPLWVTNLRLSS